MPKTISNPYWGPIPVCGPRSYDYYMTNEEVKSMVNRDPNNPYTNSNYEWLEPNSSVTNQKSFYKRAYVERYVDPNTGVIKLEVLYSYGTPVAAIAYPWDNGERRLLRLWDDWSATTAKHFQSFFGVKLSKAEWLDMEVFSRIQVERYALNGQSLYWD